MVSAAAATLFLMAAEVISHTGETELPLTEATVTKSLP